eukprot:scaffold93234_cov61-Phaeocystis_antarctica.AAC.5
MPRVAVARTRLIARDALPARPTHHAPLPAVPAAALPAAACADAPHSTHRAPRKQLHELAQPAARPATLGDALCPCARCSIPWPPPSCCCPRRRSTHHAPRTMHRAPGTTHAER